MAGEGIKLFLSGDVLTASDLNGYLMDQVISVFDNISDRNNAFGDGVPVSVGGSGKPLLTAGRFCYISDLQEVQYYNGSTWQAASQFSIEDGSITEGKLASNAVTAAKIASGAVTEAKIGSAAVTEAKIGSGAVTETKIATGAVTSAKIADGAIVDADINAAAAIADTKLATISTADKVSISSINIDGGTDIGAALADADLFVVDDGGAGTNRKAAATRISTYVFGKVSGDITIDSSGVASLTNDVTNLDDLGDVDASTPGTSQVLMWTGSQWQAQTIPLSPPDDDQPVLASRIFR